MNRGGKEDITDETLQRLKHSINLLPSFQYPKQAGAKNGRVPEINGHEEQASA